jgi:hypothetical protein
MKFVQGELDGFALNLHVIDSDMTHALERISHARQTSLSNLIQSAPS